MSNIVNLNQYVNNKNVEKSNKMNNEIEYYILQFFKERNIAPHQVPNLHIALAVLKGTIDAYYGQDSDLVSLLSLSINLQKEMDDLEGRRMI